MQAAGVEPRFEEWKGEGSLTDLSLSLNLKRRHLDESQPALVAARLAKMMEGEANKRRGRRRAELGANLHPIPLGASRVQAGALTGLALRRRQGVHAGRGGGTQAWSSCGWPPAACPPPSTP